MPGDVKNEPIVDTAISELEDKMMSYCNLVPVGCWGFDDDVKEALKQRKHSLVNRQLNKNERKKLSAQRKQQLARGLGLVPNTVQEVLEYMSNSKQLSKVQPIKRQELPKPIKKENDNTKKEKVSEKIIKKVEEESDDDDDEPESNEESEDEEGSADESEEDDDDDEKETEEVEMLQDGEEVEEDSSDEEEEDQEPVAKKPKVSGGAVLKTDEKLDNEIKKLEEEEDNESPEIKRQLALLRLQKKLKEMKKDRKKTSGKGKITASMAEQITEEKRMKRRESKMKLKQRRAEEKKNKEAKKVEVKKEETGAVENDENTEKTPSGISFNKLKFEIKADTKGKKQRTAKKDRGLKLTGRDYKSLIAKVEETKAQIAKVREADPHKATIMEDEMKWEKTMKRAGGGKVKDNLEMLKKALAKKNKMKEKRKEKWDNRVDKIDGEKKTKQDKRKNNLQKRIDDVKKRKLTKLRKKGRVL